jgi:hypothetical protein
MTPQYLKDSDLARWLGTSAAWFRENRPRLEREGFPAKDRLIGLTLLADVQAWLDRRRVVADAVPAPTTSGTINYGAL